MEDKGGSIVALWLPPGVDPKHAMRLLGTVAGNMADSLSGGKQSRPSSRDGRVPLMVLDSKEFDNCVSVDKEVNVRLNFARFDEDLCKLLKLNPFIPRPRGM